MTRPARPQSAPGGFYDEAFEHGSDGVAAPRPHYAELVALIASMEGRDLRRAAELANRSFLHRGVTFTVYSDGDQGIEPGHVLDQRGHPVGGEVGENLGDNSDAPGVVAERREARHS